AVAIVPDEASFSRAQRGAAQGGVLAEIQKAPLTRVPLADESFDLVVIDDTDGTFGALSEVDRTSVVREALRILRPGGRAMVIGSGPASGIARLFRSSGGFAFDVASTLQASGFKSVRTLAEREGLAFVEGLKARGHSVPAGAHSPASPRPASGLNAVRTLAEREGLAFVEGLKARGHSVPAGAQSEASPRA